MLAALVLLLTSAWAVPAQASSASCPGGGPCVALTVVRGDGSQTTTAYPMATVLDSTDQQGARDYRLRSVPGGPADDSRLVTAGTSIRSFLLNVAKVDPTSVDDSAGGIQVSRVDSSGAVALTGEPGDTSAVGDPGYDFVDGQQPIFWSPGTGSIDFIRPLRNDDSDVNSRDDIQTQGEIAVTVHTTGAALTPKVTGPSTVATGKSAAFSVTFSGTQPSSDATYTWSFTGTADAAAPRSTTHQWRNAGTKRVTVRVTQSDGSSGVASLPVTVGKKKSGGKDGATGDKKDKNAPSLGNNGGKGPGGGPGGAGGPRNQDGNGPTPGSTSPSTGTTPNQQKTTPGKRAATDSAPAGTRVEGVLLDADQATSVSVAAPPSADVAAAAARRGRDIPRDWRRLLGGVPLLLLGAGVLRQTRWLVGRLPEPPWRQQ